jgi:hypothetical protein
VYPFVVINGAAMVCAVLCDVGHDLQAAQLGHELVGVITLFIFRPNLCGVEQTG